METNRQLEEIMSWRFITEFWRRFPNRFYLIEAHPGGGQYDCLVLLAKGKNPKFAIDVNRGGGSVHIHKNAFGLGDDITLHSDWLSRMLQPTPAKFLNEIAQEARLVPPKQLPASTPVTIVYRPCIFRGRNTDYRPVNANVGMLEYMKDYFFIERFCSVGA
jgi:hypothetical protein